MLHNCLPDRDTRGGLPLKPKQHEETTYLVTGTAGCCRCGKLCPRIPHSGSFYGLQRIYLPRRHLIPGPSLVCSQDTFARLTAPWCATCDRPTRPTLSSRLRAGTIWLLVTRCGFSESLDTHPIIICHHDEEKMRYCVPDLIATHLIDGRIARSRAFGHVCVCALMTRMVIPARNARGDIGARNVAFEEDVLGSEFS